MNPISDHGSRSVRTRKRSGLRPGSFAGSGRRFWAFRFLRSGPSCACSPMRNRRSAGQGASPIPVTPLGSSRCRRDGSTESDTGGFTTKRCGRLDTVAFLTAAREWLRGGEPFGTAGWRRAMREAPPVWCLRSRIARSGAFPRSAGETGPRDDPDDSCAGIPGNGDRPRRQMAGATRRTHLYRVGLHLLNGIQEIQLPLPESRAELSAFLDRFLPCSWELVKEDAGIRPMANRGRPFLARHPDRPNQVLFNGLGSRGSLLAPCYAARLLDHLGDGALLTRRCDASRFLGR